ncbi:MAG: hypothetical protein Sylvanvirus6_40 [Sylvanvirus sp.]|uniref:Uncharacterized protein n=1 Tax=Sylvanvirus sp. TaxID=2487774 RepID=A0A3G5AL64_9VIRU|nr:MAG: hypothetical protein Sylvanvirus6_40 [Sylvanvirus sp.]
MSTIPWYVQQDDLSLLCISNHESEFIERHYQNEKQWIGKVKPRHYTVVGQDGKAVCLPVPIPTYQGGNGNQYQLYFESNSPYQTNIVTGKRRNLVRKNTCEQNND